MDEAKKKDLLGKGAIVQRDYQSFAVARCTIGLHDVVSLCVRFAPESRHSVPHSRRPLIAMSGH